MQPGDLVGQRRWGVEGKTHGIIIERVHDPLAQNNKVFKILWNDGTIGNNVWDYDLLPLKTGEVKNANR